MDTLDRVAKQLHRTRTDRDFQLAWAALQAEGWSPDDLTTAGERAECVAQLRQRLTAQTGRGAPGRTPAWITAAFAASDQAAEAASHDPDVQAFRADVLHGQLIEPQTVPDWLRARTGMFEWDLLLTSQGASNAIRLPVAGPEWDSLLAFQGASNVETIPSTGSADLERLHAIGRELVKQYQWSEDKAITFVLTGRAPLRWPIQIQTTITETGATTVQVTAEAWVPAVVVTTAYQRARRAFVERVPRAPRLSARRRALAAFLTTQDGIPARTRMRTWNQAHAHWRYRDVRNFVRDSRRAAARLT